MTPDTYFDFQDKIPQDIDGCVLTMGNFDGVHLGHRQLLSCARKLADESGRPAVAVTFDPPPDLVFHPDKIQETITLPLHKATLLREAGIDHVVTIRSTKKLLTLSAEQFVDRLMKFFAPENIVEGPNFYFGAGRQGTVQLLTKMGEILGFNVHIVPFLFREVNGKSQSVCSTLIRELIRAGQVTLAEELLGRPFAITGQVVRGHGIGKKLEYPTANLRLLNQVIPAEGVYAGHATIEGNRMTAAISVGKRPTFGSGDLLIEAYIPGLDQELYGKTITLNFLRYIRKQIKFESITKLKLQMDQDIRQIQEIVEK